MAGDCLYKIPKPVLPVSVMEQNYYHPRTTGIWTSDKKECKCFLSENHQKDNT